MQKLKTISTAALAFIVVTGFTTFTSLTGCATLFPKCAPEYCASDKQITADVNQIFREHTEFGPPATVHIQTINGVVYMSGPVDSEFEVRRAEALVRQVANVKDVENNLYPRSNSR
jgi:osmotically-inducible protein OsmY